MMRFYIIKIALLLDKKYLNRPIGLCRHFSMQDLKSVRFIIIEYYLTRGVNLNNVYSYQ